VQLYSDSVINVVAADKLLVDFGAAGKAIKRLAPQDIQQIEHREAQTYPSGGWFTT